MVASQARKKPHSVVASEFSLNSNDGGLINAALILWNMLSKKYSQH